MGDLKGEGKGELPEEDEGSGKVEYAEPIVQSKYEKAEYAASTRAENTQKGRGPPKRKRTTKKSRTSGAGKLRGGFRNFGATVKKLWDVWGRFKTKNMQDPHPVSEKTFGVPGFEEIACIEAEVPDIMMMDKDRVRTSCKECMKHPPTFPSKEQIKAKLMAADKYYGVKSAKIKVEQSDNILEHEADYYDIDGTVVRPSWRYILERPLVEQYVLMTNYIRKASVLSELKEDKYSKKYIEEEDAIDDTEYRKFEQKFIKEKRELLKPILKPKTQDMAVQTSFESKQHSGENLKESTSEISLYPESEDSTSSPEASAVTIVTSRDYTSPLHSDFDGRTTEKSTSHRGGNWWESEATCQPSESFQTSYDSINKNTSSGSDGPSVPIHSTWGKTALQPARGAFSNESVSPITPRSCSVEPETHRKPKDSKKVSFSSVLTYYQGPNKNGSVYNLPDEEETTTETNRIETQQQGIAEDPTPQSPITDSPPEDQMADEKHKSQEEIPNSTATEKPNPSNKKTSLGNILQDEKPGQIVSVSLPADWSENIILHSNRKVPVVVSRPAAVKQAVSKRISFQDYDEIPDVEYSDSHVAPVPDRTDANIQTPTPVVPKRMAPEKCKPSKHRELSPHKQHDHSFAQASQNPRQSEKPLDDNHPPARLRNFSAPVTLDTPNTKILNARFNHSGCPGHVKTENIGTETNVQSLPPSHSLSAGPKLERKRVEQKFDYNMVKAVDSERTEASHTPVQRVNFPNTKIQAQVPKMENLPKGESQLADTGGKYFGNVTDMNAHPSTDPGPSSNTPRTSQNLQQQSTDTEGPSSSSNEHIKLKASPACFFNVATPTDLSKISVDEFYPDVPEIDAELSQIGKTESSVAPCVEIVFANKEPTLRCMQDADFSRASRKEESTIQQRSKKPEDDCPVRVNAPNRRTTITASAGVRIRIDEGQSKSSNTIVSSSRNFSRQSSITEGLGKSIVSAKQSAKESEGKPNTPMKSKTTKGQTDLGSTEKQATIQGNELYRNVRLTEVTPTTIQPPAKPIRETDNDLVTRSHVKVSPVTVMKMKSNVQASFEEADQQDEPSQDEETPSYKKLFNDMTEIDMVWRKIEKRSQTENPERLANDEDDDGDGDNDDVLAIQCQAGSLSMDPADQEVPYGRTKLYMRTLSSLTEETSSVMESKSSSIQEKLIDMPVMALSVEELKTIFEKKPEVALISGESEMQDRGCQSDTKKHTGFSNEKVEGDKMSRKLIEISPIDEAIKTAIEKRFQHKLDEKPSSKSQEDKLDLQRKQNLVLAAVTFDDSDAKVMTHSKSGAAEDEGLLKSEGGAHSKDKPPSALIQEESNAQLLGQIDVIRASEIYSNTSMYFSSSEDRAAKLSKARTVFQAVTLDDDLVGSSWSGSTERTANDNPEGSNRCHPQSSENSVSSEEHSSNQTHKDPKPQEQGPKSKSNHEGDNYSVGQASTSVLEDSSTRQKLGKEQGATEETHTILKVSSGSRTNTNKGLTNVITTNNSKTDDTSNPSETKHWLMDVIPVLPKNARFHGLRPHKPVCVKEATEAEATKYRQDAVKPVFRFLKRQREIGENKE